MAAPPPTALNRLTSWGIWVIATARAEYSPAAPPINAPQISTSQRVTFMCPPWLTSTSTAMIATSMPAADSWLPRRAVAGEFIMCRPSTKATAPASDASRMPVSKPLTALLRSSRERSCRLDLVGAFGRYSSAEHLQHPVGHRVAADHVGRAERGRDEGQHVADRPVDVGGEDHHADEHHAVDGVGTRHQRRVQGGRHLADHLEADQQCQHEDRD